MSGQQAFIVAREDLRQHRANTTPLERSAAGEVLLRVDRFAFTSNNITYAEYGEQIGYWSFFPAPEGWGIIPVWGFADVIESRHESIQEGERVFGFLPMATHVMVQPLRVSERNFIDGSAHRQSLPAAYNLYLRTAADPDYEPRFEDFQALIRPLFITSFLIDDLLAEENFFGARSVLISSASSKTAIALAHQLHNRQGTVEVIALTSADNQRFVTGLGYYDQTLTYVQIGELVATRPAVYVDFTGNRSLRHTVHEHYGNNLKFSCSVGFSHRKQPGGSANLPGPKPEFFFAPDRLRKRGKDWGRDGFDARFTAEWRKFLPTFEHWLTIARGEGLSAVERAYEATLNGEVAPSSGQTLSLWNGHTLCGQPADIRKPPI